MFEVEPITYPFLLLKKREASGYLTNVNGTNKLMVFRVALTSVFLREIIRGLNDMVYDRSCDKMLFSSSLSFMSLKMALPLP